MKHFRFLAAAFALVAVASCEGLPGTGNENEDNNGDGGGSAIVNNLPYVEPKDRVVAREEYGRIYYYKYDQQGRLSEITCCWENSYSEVDEIRVETMTFSYEGLLVKSNEVETVYEKLGEYDPLAEFVGKDTYICKGEDLSDIRWTEGVLGASGRLATVSYYRNGYDGFNDKYTRYLSALDTYTYDAYGNLIGFVERYDSGDGGALDYEDSYVCAWENGNPKYLDYGEGEKYHLSFREEEYVWPGVNIYYDLDGTDYYGDVDVTGLDGRKWANLLDKVYAINPETNEESYMKMVYTFDAKGRVKTINSYFAEGDDVGEMDDSDAVTFYYGDEALPEPPASVPVHLVKQECVSSFFGMHKSEGDSYLGGVNFDITHKVKSTFSDGTTSIADVVNSDAFSFYCDVRWPEDGGPLTREQFRQLQSSINNPVVDVFVNQQDTELESDPYFSGHIDVACPYLGTVTCNLHLDSRVDPQYVYLYDSEKSPKYYYYKGCDTFTPEFFRSRIKVSAKLTPLDYGEMEYDNYEINVTVSMDLHNQFQFDDFMNIRSESVVLEFSVEKE